MRLFVLYDRDGTIRSAMKVEIMGEGLDHPYGPLEESQAVLEAPVTEELGNLAPREICERFVVEPQRRELVARNASPTPPRGARRRRSARARRVRARRAFRAEAAAMGRTTRLHHAVRPQHAVQPRAVETTSPRPAAVARSPLVSLQRSIGNQALGRLVQAKLRSGRPGDRFEREADRVADQVLRMRMARLPPRSRASRCPATPPELAVTAAVAAWLAALIDQLRSPRPALPCWRR